jgi:arylsulfatase A-like enzyme
MPLCCPARGAFLTSRYPHECVPGHEYPLPAGQKTIADVFNAAGYSTGYFGKWRLAGFHESEGPSATRIVPPEKRGGFQTWVGYDNNNSQYDSWVHGGVGKDAFQYRLPGYETDELTNLFIRHIKDQAKADRPFFAALSVQPPHDPYVAPPEFMERHTPGRIELRPNVPNVPSIIEPRAGGSPATTPKSRISIGISDAFANRSMNPAPRSAPTSSTSATTATCRARRASSRR